MKVLNLLSGPRNISTALMYSFAQRTDCEVMDEPFYGNYLRHATLANDHPMQDEIMESLGANETEIIEEIETKANRTNVFVKGMAHHILSDDPSFLLRWKNILLIRDPEKLIVSFSKIIPNPTLDDIGLKKSVTLFEYLQNHGSTPVVLDSDELMKAPLRYIKMLCRHLEIPFQPQMLQWNAGGIAEDGIWARHWYQNVHKTTGFKTQQKTAVSVPDHLEPLLQKAQPLYDMLQPYILKNTPNATDI